MPRVKRLPSPELEPLLDEIRTTIAKRRELTRRQAQLLLEANEAGLSARTLSEEVGEPEGTLFMWIRKAKAEASTGPSNGDGSGLKDLKSSSN